MWQWQATTFEGGNDEAAAGRQLRKGAGRSMHRMEGQGSKGWLTWQALGAQYNSYVFVSFYQ